MSGILQAMATLIDVFNKYAGKEGNKETLTKKELSELLRSEFLGAETSNKAEMDEFFEKLDDNKDGVVDFTEYVTFVTALTVVCNRK